jgi:serine/threonine protein kinase
MESIDERIKDIVVRHESLAVHAEKFGIVADCLYSFLFFKHHLEPQKGQEQSAVRIDSALAEMQAIIMMLGPNEWLLYTVNSPIENVRSVILAKIQEISEYSNKLFPGASGIFDVPMYKWDFAELQDVSKLKMLLKNVPKAEFMNPMLTKQSIMDELQALSTRYENAKSFSTQPVHALRKFFIPIEKLCIDRKIGSGTFSSIFHATYNGSEVIVKFFFGAHCRQEHFDQFMMEASAFANVSHPSIVKFYGVTSSAPFLIITEFMDGGSLFHVLQTPSTLLNPRSLDVIALSVARGLLYLHKLDAIHGDVKSLNILLSKKGVVKLCDFGSCRQLKSPNPDNGPIGTVAWSAPEMLRPEGERSLTPKADVFSFGVVLLEMITRKPPEIVGPRVVPSDAPPKLRTLIEKCLSADPALRPPMSEIVTMFEKELVSFDKPADATVTESMLDALISSETKESFDLLGDVCAEIKDSCAYVLPRIVKVKPTDISVTASLIRVLRAICRTKDYVEQCIQYGCVELCLRSLEKKELQVRALFLLLSIVRQSRYRFTQQELKILADWPDSDLVTLCLMYGVDYDERLAQEFIRRILACHAQLLPSLLCGLRAFIATRTQQLSSLIVHKIRNVLFGVLQGNEETSAAQALFIFADILSTTDIILTFKSPHMILIGKWVFVKNTAIHASAVQLLVLIATRDNLIVNTDGSYDFMIILLHSLPLSCVQPVLGDIILRFLERRDIADWFVIRQLEASLSNESSLQMKFILFKMMCIVVCTGAPALSCASAIKVTRDLIDTGDIKTMRLVCRFLVISGKIQEYFKVLGSSRFVDFLETTQDPLVAADIMILLTEAHKLGVKVEIKRSASLAQKYLGIDCAALKAVNLIHASYSTSKDKNLITAELRKVLSANEDDDNCANFLSEIS